MSRKIGEFDDYPIPAYDPTILENERKRLKEEAIKNFKKQSRGQLPLTRPQIDCAVFLFGTQAAEAAFKFDFRT